MGPIAITNVSKLIIAAIVVICCTVLLATNSIDPGAGMAPITLIIGYMLGNGVAAITNKPVTPVIGRPNDDSIPAAD